MQTRWLLVQAEIFDTINRSEAARLARHEALRQATERVEHRGAATALIDRALVYLALDNKVAAEVDLLRARRLLRGHYGTEAVNTLLEEARR